MTPHLPVVPDRPTVRVVHPCGSFDDARRAHLRRGVERLERAGCRVRWDEAISARSAYRGYLAGTDRQRQKELLDAFTEPGVDLVWAARGGSGAARIARGLTEGLVGVPPRLLVGFSDVTTYHAALNQRLGWPTIHGPVLTTLAYRDADRQAVADVDEVLAVLTGARTHLTFEPQAGAELLAPLYGGNLTVLASLCGMGLLPTVPRALWLLEDHAEPPYALDRALTQLRLGSAVDRAAALWLGDLGLDRDRALRRALAQDVLAPVYEGAPAGHRGQIAALPLGVSVRFTPERGLVSWTVERAVG
ncbi:MAG: LD-carboxypeptidase [Myxococcales bacterium]|nr:LD-carboxypeptidase [Myxococcales bacterium]